jgi:hypothetical protein
VAGIDGSDAMVLHSTLVTDHRIGVKRGLISFRYGSWLQKATILREGYDMS